ncbi:hypothetical protein EBV26_12365 [bacterium]|nr:hypothetical protein [bacterium]
MPGIEWAHPVVSITMPRYGMPRGLQGEDTPATVRLSSSVVRRHGYMRGESAALLLKSAGPANRHSGGDERVLRGRGSARKETLFFCFR